MHERVRKICIYLHLTTIMVAMYETLEREEFAMNGILLIFFIILWNMVKTYLWQKYISFKWVSASLKSSSSVHTLALSLSVSATKGTQDRDNSVCTK